MDDKTLEGLAELICGDIEKDHPVYRKGHELTSFFQGVGFANFRHDGTTRKWWTLDVLRQLTPRNLDAVIVRLADPREYRGDEEQTTKAITCLNRILMPEGRRIALVGLQPAIERITPQFAKKGEAAELRPLPPPDFINLALPHGLGDVLADRWDQAQRCINAAAYLAATIVMGSMLEGILRAVLERNPREANLSKAAPVDRETGKPLLFAKWSLSDMINVAHELGWLDRDVHAFSHALREFRNLVHPYEQLRLGTYPDRDTCDICWLVVQAAANDLAEYLCT